MARLMTLDHQEWRKLENADNSAILSTSTKEPVTYTVGSNSAPVALKTLSADPAHPFTAGQMVFTAATVTFRDGTMVDLAHSPDYPRQELIGLDPGVAHTVHSGGFYLSNYRVPLEWRIAITAGTPSNFFELELYRPDEVVIDADDRTDVAITIDPDTEAATPANIVITDAVSTPGGGRGGVILRKAITDVQLGHLRPVDGDGNRVHKKIGVTIAVAATTPVISYSSYDETHPSWDEANYLLRLGQTIGLQLPSSGGWYGRATTDATPVKIQVG